MTKIPTETTCLLLPSLHDAEEARDFSRNKQSPKRWKIAGIVVIVSLTAICSFCFKAKHSDVSYGHQVHELSQNYELFRAESVERLRSAEKHLQARSLLLSKHSKKEPLNHLIYLNHSEAFEMLNNDNDESSANDFYLFQQGWEAQVTQAYCGVASAAAALNSYRGHIKLSIDPIYHPYPWATQREILVQDCVVENVTHDYENSTLPRLYAGLGLPMARKLLECHLAPQNYIVEQHIMDPFKKSVESMRRIIKAAVLDKDSRVIINYDRGGIGQGPMGHGHFSPLGAYNKDLDAFLIMDVAKYKFPPVWVPAANLFGGVATLDMCSDFDYPVVPKELKFNCRSNFRGFLVIKPAN